METTNPITRTLSSLGPYTLCAWRGANSSMRPLLCVCIYIYI